MFTTPIKENETHGNVPFVETFFKKTLMLKNTKLCVYTNELSCVLLLHV